MVLKRVSEKAYMILGKSDSIYDGWGANQGFVTTKQGVLVVDTGFTVGIARRLAREIKKASVSPLRVVVNTHDHSDHVFGNSVFTEEGRALILAHSHSRSRLGELGAERMRGYRRYDTKLKASMERLRIRLPLLTYDDQLEFSIGETKVRLIHPKKGAHTKGDTMVYLPQERILFAGDILWVGYHPNIEDADITGWIDTLEKISKMDVDTIVPGHGKVGDKRSLQPLGRYLREFHSRFAKLVSEGTPRDDIASQLRISGSEDWLLEMIVQRNVEMLYDSYRSRAMS